MILAAAMLAAALTRAEMIERLKTPPVVMMEGLVEVRANCPADMRREYQMPVASFAYDICKALYVRERIKPSRRPRPGIEIVLGDAVTNDTRVLVFPDERETGKYLRIYLPAPGFADLEKLRLEVARGFYLSVKGEDPGDDALEEAMRDADPAYRRRREYGQLKRWKEGEPTERDDLQMIKLSFKVINPGRATTDDILRFASRLYLYPDSFDKPFCGRYRACGMKEAVLERNRDVRIRFAAFKAMPLVAAYGGGRGEALQAAADAYGALLLEIARGNKSDGELLDMLDAAETKLNIAMENARQEEENEKNHN